MVDTRRKSPVFALRFRAYGHWQYVTLGSADQGWTRDKAEQALSHTLADVERGIWRPPDRELAPTLELPENPTFHEFASQWFKANEGSWRPSTRAGYSWELTNHLLPVFAGHRLSQITIAEVDRYKAAKVREGVLSATSINKTITRLAQILDVADEYGMIDRNPAKGKRRRVKAAKAAPVWLDRAEHIAALLDLCWRDVDLTAGRITVRASKTDAGVRQIDMLPVLRDELLELKASPRRTGPNERVFATRQGHRQSPSNMRDRVLAPAVKRANQRLGEAGEVPLPERLTPHKLRHTFASLLVALGVDPGSVMDQLGHTDPAFTLRVYRHGMRRDEQSKQALRQLVGLSDWAATGSNAIPVQFEAVAGAR